MSIGYHKIDDYIYGTCSEEDATFFAAKLMEVDEYFKRHRIKMCIKTLDEKLNNK